MIQIFKNKSCRLKQFIIVKIRKNNAAKIMK